MPSQQTRIRHIMAKSIVHVPTAMRIREVALLMRRNGVGSVLVSEGEDFLGILTETDIVHKAVAKGLNAQMTRADSIMSFPIIEINADETVLDAAENMVQNGIRHLAVSEKGKIIGILSLRDLIQPLQASRETPGPIE